MLAFESSGILLGNWLSLFGSVDVVFLNLVMELFKDITDYFMKVAITDSLKHFKSTVPKQKKQQALRERKNTAIGERKNPKKMKQNYEKPHSDYVMRTTCVREPTDAGEQSIACDIVSCPTL